LLTEGETQEECGMDAKQETLEQILLAWRANPTLRLGQLLESACNTSGRGLKVFYASDDALAKAALDYNTLEVRRLKKTG